MIVVGQDQRVDVCIEESKKEYTYSVHSDTPNTTFYWYVDGVYHFGQTLTINWETYSPGVHDIAVYGKTEGCLSDPIRYKVYVGECSSIYVPNAFTPSKPGKNDHFYVQGTGVKEISYLRIYNRWGNLVFSTQHTQINKPELGWDGTFGGRELSSDVFMYQMQVECANGTLFPITGNFTLIR